MDAEISPPERARSDTSLSLALAVAVVLMHAVRLFSSSELLAGGDLPPHLRLIQVTQESVDVHNVYAPFYHLLGALLTPIFGTTGYPKVFALLSVAGLLFGFRYFQRAAGLPAATAEVFAVLPYSMAMTWCLPKIEFAGFAVAFVALAQLCKRRYVPLALLTGGLFYVHTASTLVYGVAAGTIALARRDLRALGALAAGTTLALPLVWANHHAGCSFAQGLLMSGSGYLPSGGYDSLADLRTAWPLAAPLLIVVALAGARATWRGDRAIALACFAMLVIYLQPAWMPLVAGSHGGGYLRGLSVLMLPTAVGAGYLLANMRRLRIAVLIASGAWLIANAVVFMPQSCWTGPVNAGAVDRIEVFRCEFSWRTRFVPP